MVFRKNIADSPWQYIPWVWQFVIHCLSFIINSCSMETLYQELKVIVSVRDQHSGLALFFINCCTKIGILLMNIRTFDGYVTVRLSTCVLFYYVALQRWFWEQVTVTLATSKFKRLKILFMNGLFHSQPESTVLVNRSHTLQITPNAFILPSEIVWC